jgi:hypothetical protein
MSILEFFIAEQTSGGQTTLSSNSPTATYLLIGLLAAVMVLVVWMFIRANARRSSKRQG